MLKALAVLIDVGVPLAATLSQFPVWVERSAAATVSGVAVFFILLSVLPFIRQIKAYFKSPSVWVMWGLFFLLFYALSEIIEEITLICFFGFVSNLLGEVIYKIGVKKSGEKQ